MRIIAVSIATFLSYGSYLTNQHNQHQICIYLHYDLFQHFLKPILAEFF